MKQIEDQNLSFELVLDKYREELLNMCISKSNPQYWREQSNLTYERLIRLYNEKVDRK